MIQIKKSATADTRTCDFANTSKETLLESSRTHIGDVVKALAFFSGKLTEAAGEHDYDKLTAIDWFHADFITGFKQTGWWDNHRKIHRHHLDQEDGIPEDVNLLDLLEYIADCVMAGMARSGSIYELTVTPELLTAAFHNTVGLLKAQVVVQKESTFKDRVVAEKAELEEKATKLSEFIGNNPAFENLDPAEQERMKTQNDVMWQYVEVLGARIAAFQ